MYVVAASVVSLYSVERMLQVCYVSRVWVKLVLQGDREEVLGLSISPLCDRKNTHVAESQIGKYHHHRSGIYTGVVLVHVGAYTPNKASGANPPTSAPSFPSLADQRSGERHIYRGLVLSPGLPVKDNFALERIAFPNDVYIYTCK